MYTDGDLSKDLERIRQIPIVPTILDVICETTGMGFAAVARVTPERWIACSVQDDIRFGLVPGDELKIETTICNEIQGNREAVIIDHVQESVAFCNHHTPLMYGFQSYISFPIILKNGEFFGTLCAIDPRPAQLNNSKVVGLFSLFADLISFHIQQLDLLDRTQFVVQNLSQQLTDSIDENRQYQRLSSHHLQEPLRKIRIFSEMLVDATDRKDVDQMKGLASKVNSSAQKFSLMIKGLTDFSVLDDDEIFFEQVDLNKVVADVSTRLRPQLNEKKATIHAAELPTVQAIPSQIEQLFYHLISNAIKFSKSGVLPLITITHQELSPAQRQEQLPTGAEVRFVQIQIEDNGIGIEHNQLEKIFDLFAQLPTNKDRIGEGFGLAYCRKIIRNHAGLIRAQSTVGEGTTISIRLPVA
ncbi:GAF domain-containing sensor histidine kinase [Larkinella ripae]